MRDITKAPGDLGGIQDEMAVLNQLAREKPQSAELRRFYVRSYFAMAEAIVRHLMDVAKVAVLGRLSKEGKTLEDFVVLVGKCQLLSEVEFTITGKGELAQKPSRLPLRNRALFALNILAGHHNLDIDVRELDGWSDFCTAIKIRDRITHPDRKEDLEVTIDEIETVNNGHSWLMEAFREATDNFRRK